MEAEEVDDREIALARDDGDDLVLDVAVAAAVGGGGDAQGVALVALGERGDRLGDGGGEQEGAAVAGSGVEQALEVLAEAHVEHLVGLVEHDGGEAIEDEGAALEVVAQAAGRADDDVDAGGEGVALAPGVHAADAGGDPRAGLGVEPGELAVDLQGELAGRGDDQGARGAGRSEPGGVAEQRRGEREAEGDGLARAGLRRDQEVALQDVGREDRGLDGGGRDEAARGEGPGEARVGR